MDLDSSACLRAAAPSSGALNDLREPLMEPVGVRLAATITASMASETVNMPVIGMGDHAPLNGMRMVVDGNEERKKQPVCGKLSGQTWLLISPKLIVRFLLSAEVLTQRYRRIRSRLEV